MGNGAAQQGGVYRGRFCLVPYESLYLMHTGRVALDGARGRRRSTPSSRRDEDVLTRFLVYRDLRARGYAAKGGFGFGADFRVYDRGRFGDKAASYVVFALAEPPKRPPRTSCSRWPSPPKGRRPAQKVPRDRAHGQGADGSRR